MSITIEDVKPHFNRVEDISPNEFRCECPIHKSKSKALYIVVKDNKWVNGKCHGNCDAASVRQYLLDLGFNKPNGKTNKKTEPFTKLQPVPKKHIEHWTGLMHSLHNKGFILKKTLFVYSDMKGNPIALVARKNLPDGKKQFFYNMLAINNQTKKVEVIKNGPDEPKPLYVCNGSKPDEIDTLHIYEGEKTCEAGHHIFKHKENVLHITWGFGSGGQNKADWKSLSKYTFKEIVLFPDNDDAGLKAMRNVSTTLFSLGHPIINTLDVSSFPKKWDVADIKDDKDLNKMMELYEKPVAVEKEEPLEYAYINHQDLFYNLKQNVMYGATHFGRVIKGTPYFLPQFSKPIKSTADFLDDVETMKVDKLEFEPDKPKQFTRDNATCLNSYAPYYIRPIESDITPFTNLLDVWFPNNLDNGEGEYYKWWLTCWYAHNIQFSGRKIMSAPVIISPEGYGKGTIFQIFQKMLGRQYVSEVTQRQLESPFNPYVFRKLMLFFDELRVEQGSRINIMNLLKFMITEPMIEYNDKYKLARDITNTFNICCYSNHRNAITIKGDARRWFAHYIENKPTEEHFTQLLQLKDNKSGAIYKYLKEFDLSEWKSWKEPPKTKFFYEIVESTERQDVAWLKSAYQENRPPFHPDCSLLIVDDIVSAAKHLTPNGIKILPLSVQTFLKEMGAKPLGQIRLHGEKPSVWDMDPDRVRPATPNELIQEYIKPVVIYVDGQHICTFKRYEDLNPIIESSY